MRRMGKIGWWPEDPSFLLGTSVLVDESRPGIVKRKEGDGGPAGRP